MVAKIKVGVVSTQKAAYPDDPPYHPSAAYPEYPFPGVVSKGENLVYHAVRDLFYKLGFDTSHYNTAEWNPLGTLIKPGMVVVIKPNFVLSRHFEGKELFSIITHPSVIRVIADYCWIALKGEGKIIIADAPQYNCNFNELIDKTKLDYLCSFYRTKNQGPKVEFLNLQPYWSRTRHMPSCIRKLPGDPEGSILINLGKKSALYNLPNPGRLYGAVYHRNETIAHHLGENQEYQVSKSILNADVFISVPKMKVHKKVGVTLNGKGLVGICTNKNLVVHYRLGTPKEGGDQFPDGFLTPTERKIIKFERWMYDHFLARRTISAEACHRVIYGFFYLKILKPLGLKVPEEKRLYDAGNWYGNDTAWRMVVDLMKIIYFSDKNGKLHNKPQRKLFSVIDGVIGGENKGPLVPDPKYSGVLIGGENLLAVDIVTTRLMGFDPFKLQQFSLLNEPDYNFGFNRIEDIEVISDNPEFRNCLEDKTNRYFSYKPYPGWVGHIEI